MSTAPRPRSRDVAFGLAELLGLAGVERVYGPRSPLVSSTEWVEVPAAVAPVLAVADRWVHGGRSAITGGDTSLVVGAVEATPTREVRVEEPDQVAEAGEVVLAELRADPSASVRIVVTADPAAAVGLLRLDAPAPGERWTPPDHELIERVQAAARPMLVVGPGVVSAGAVPGLQALAAAADLGVLNTWGAKGVFDWRSRHHWATVGLQADDLTRGGVADADLVVLSGVDPDELDVAELARLTSQSGATVLSVEPTSLAPLAEHWRRSDVDLVMPPLRADLAQVTQQGWSRTAAPLAPTKVTAHYAQALAGGAFVAAAPGRAGYWVARTFATTFLGGARVPARRHPPGVAVACAIVAGSARPGARRPLAVADGPLDAASAELLEVAERLGVVVALELWDPDGARLDADEHQTRLGAQLASAGSSVATLATDRTQLDEMLAVAGPVSAWGGLTPEELR